MALYAFEDKLPSGPLQPVAIEHVRNVHSRGDVGRGLVGGGARRFSGAFSRLPEAEREAFAPLVGVALEVLEEATGTQGFLVGAVVVLAQEVEVGVGPPHGTEK